MAPTRDAPLRVSTALPPFERLDVDIVAATPTRLAAAWGDYSSVLH